MKIAIVSDIHGNLAALQAVLEEIEREQADVIVNLGDILSGPLLPAETAEFLMARDWPTVAGNHERQLLALRERPESEWNPRDSDGYAATQLNVAHLGWLRKIPPTHWLRDDVLLVHGTPGSDLEYWLETTTPDHGHNGSSGLRAATAAEVEERLASGDPRARDAALVLCGHTHVPRAVHCGRTLIVNPGSVGVQAYAGSLPHRHDTANGSPHARYAIVEERRAGWAARLCATPYDWAPMARLAQERGRPGWAYALTTGRMPAAVAKIAP